MHALTLINTKAAYIANVQKNTIIPSLYIQNFDNQSTVCSTVCSVQSVMERRAADFISTYDGQSVIDFER